MGESWASHGRVIGESWQDGTWISCVPEPASLAFSLPARSTRCILQAMVSPAPQRDTHTAKTSTRKQYEKSPVNGGGNYGCSIAGVQMSRGGWLGGGGLQTDRP